MQGLGFRILDLGPKFLGCRAASSRLPRDRALLTSGFWGLGLGLRGLGFRVSITSSENLLFGTDKASSKTNFQHPAPQKTLNETLKLNPKPSAKP